MAKKKAVVDESGSVDESGAAVESEPTVIVTPELCPVDGYPNAAGEQCPVCGTVAK